MKYLLGRVGKYFVRNQNGAFLAPLMALTHANVLLESWFRFIFFKSLSWCLLNLHLSNGNIFLCSISFYLVLIMYGLRENEN